MLIPTRVLLPAALALATVAACGGSTAAPASTAGDSGGSVAAAGPATAQTIEVIGTAALTFRPATVSARVGTLVLTLGNEGGTPHNLHFDDAALPKIPLVGAGQTKAATVRFDRPGTYTFVCTIHSGMRGKVVVS